MREADAKNINIIRHYIPGHTGMKGSETVDNLAKIGSQLNVPCEEKVIKEDFYPLLKKKYKIEELEEVK